MTQKYLLPLLSFLGMSISLNAQSISGKVSNEQGKNVSYVEVIVSAEGRKLSAITDDNGLFSINIPKNDAYTINFFLNGSKVYEGTEEINGNVNKNYTIKETDVKEIKEISLTQKKKLVERKVDRLIFNVENSVSATGGTALDALKTTPLVRIQDEMVSIVGKGEVLVMIDDRIQRMSPEDLSSLLKSIPSDNIQSIEVITTPPAKYDAEGDNGLINIRLKKGKANSWNANIGSSYTQKTYAGGALQGAFNYNHNRLSIQLTANTSSQQLRTTSDSRIYYPDELWNTSLKNKSKERNLGLGLGIDYKISDKWTTGVKYLGSFTKNTSSNSPFTTRTNSETQIINSYITSDVDANDKPHMNSINWYNSFKIDSAGTKITTDFDYFNYRKSDYSFFAGNERDQQRNILPGSFFSATNTNMNRIENYSGKADVEMPLEWASLSFGAKYTYTNTNNDLVVFDNKTGSPVLNTDQSNIFNYKEHNEALYVSGSKKLDEKWEAQAGLRMEATQTTGYSHNLNQTNKINYVKLFPTAYITYTPDDKNSFSLNYSRRIRRPNFDYLNPFVVRTSPYYYSEGNPFLQPSVIDNLEFSYIRNQKWVSSVYYSQVSDFSQKLSILDQNTNITRSTPLNYANTYQIGISTYYNFNKWSWWNSFTGFNANYQNVKSKIDAIRSIDGYNAYIYSNNDFTLNSSKTAFFSVNYGLQLPGRYQIFQISTLHILDVSMKFLFLDKKLTLTIAGQDLLNRQRPTITYESNGVKTDFQRYGDTRGFRISLAYKFGNKNLKSEQRKLGNEDERNRVK
ncbi:outer membrane beta-barrel family protein [Chryseobacterium pennipullorum]|uniref:TonB-dependent receptor n=1 Tax=Chryseobacterium pennipullorum TaxID=2258963 RepID=A0A3D9AMP6_9FLAO|nr:outer membrane beta-barrel family protein [Chryseobacterium pennipullorum]REC42372.1 TonB-dependent receptor [Chryseobacterium pennipullorum]